MPKLIDLTGRRFGRLLVTGVSKRRTKNGHVIFECQCNCGTKHLTPGENLRAGKTRSCGCLHHELARAQRVKHDLSNTPEYGAWVNARRNMRINGTYMSPRWEESFMVFLEDMGRKPSIAHYLVRLEKHKGYTKENCIWKLSETKLENLKKTMGVT